MPTALKTQVGRALGSAASRRLLSQDQIPAVVYGHGMQPLAVTVDRKDLRVALSGPAGLNTVLELHVGSDKYPAIVKEVQRDPVKRNVRHVDFQQISMTQVITVHVPLHLKGNAKAVLAEVTPAMLRAQERILEPLPAAERRQFMRMLRTLVETNNAESRAPSEG